MTKEGGLERVDDDTKLDPEQLSLIGPLQRETLVGSWSGAE